MANGVRGEETVTIGGKKFTLEPSFERLAQIEAVLGRSLMTVVQDPRPGFSLTELAGIVQALAKDCKLKPNQLGALILKEGPINLLPVIVKIITHGLVGDQAAEGSGDADEGKLPAGD